MGPLLSEELDDVAEEVSVGARIMRIEAEVELVADPQPHGGAQVAETSSQAAQRFIAGALGDHMLDRADVEADDQTNFWAFPHKVADSLAKGVENFVAGVVDVGIGAHHPRLRVDGRLVFGELGV